MIKRLHILVFKSYIGPLVMTFFIAEFVLMMHFLWLYIEDLVGKGLEWTIVAELLLYASAGLVKMALPLSILLASIMTFGNFGEHFELTAMKSAGISLQRIMFPLVLFSVLISILSFFWSNNVIPYTNLKTGALLYDVTNQRPELNLKPGIFNQDIEGYTLKIKGKNPNSPMMYDFMIYDHQDNRGNPKVTLADSGYMHITDNQRYMVVTLYGGRSYEEMNEKSVARKIFPERHETFDKETIILELKGFDLERTDETLFKHHYQMKTVTELQRAKDSLIVLLIQRKDKFINLLKKTRFFKNSVSYRPKQVFVTDSIKSKLEEKIPNEVQLNVIAAQSETNKGYGNIDSLFESFDVNEKSAIIEMALHDANEVKGQIESNNIDINEKQTNVYKHQIAWHEKFTLSFACLIFFFIGAPLGAIIRKGGFGLPFLVSILFFILYYIISIAGRKFVEESVLLPWQGMWLSSLLTLPLGVIFTYKATTDSALFNIEAYGDFIKRPFKALQIQYKDPTIVFHKDVTIPDEENILIGIKSLISYSSIIKEKVAENIKSSKVLYRSLFNEDNNNLKIYLENYNQIYEILSVKFREKKFYRAILEKFPKIDLTIYSISRKKIIYNYIFLTIGIFPFGLLLMLSTMLKLRVLKQKIELVESNLKSMVDMIN